MRRHFPVIFLGLLIVVVHSGAQITPLTSDIVRPSPGVGHDYVKGLSETVNPATGTLSLSIQLPVVPSRGLTLPFSILYNSGSVHHPTTQIYEYGTIAHLTMDNSGQGVFPTDLATNGWSDSFPYASVSSIDVDQPTSFQGIPTGATGACFVSNSYNFYAPSGQSFPLGITAVSHLQGSNNDAADPMYCIEQGWSSYSASSTYGYGAQILGGVCDGSTNSDSTPGCNRAAPAFSVTDPDRTTYKFAANSYAGIGRDSGTTSTIAFPTQIEDRNGNILQVASGWNGSQIVGPTVMKDTAGRDAVRIDYMSGIYNGQSLIPPPHIYTVGGLTYTVNYGSTTAHLPSGTIQYQRVDPQPGGVSCSPSFAVVDANLQVVTSITLPNNTSQYTFQYDPDYGLINEIDYPGGGWVKYEWDLNGKSTGTYSDFVSAPGTVSPDEQPVSYSSCNYRYQSPAVKTRTVGYVKDGPAVLRQDFSYSTTWNPGNFANWSEKTTTVTTTDYVTGEQYQTVYTYSSVNQILPPPPPGGGQLPVQIPVEKKIVTSQWGTTSPSSLVVATVNKQWIDQYEMTHEDRTFGNGATPQYNSNRTFRYPDLVNSFPELPDSIQECDNSIVGSTTPECRTTTYQYFGLSSPCQVAIYAGQFTGTPGSGTPLAKSDAYYDGSNSPCASGHVATGNQVSGLAAGTRDAAYASGASVYRGNVTKVVRLSSLGTSPTITYAYDETGQRVSTTDACGNTDCSSDMEGDQHTTSYSYTDSPLGATNSNAYVTQITYPTPSSGVAMHEDFTYDYVTGNLASAKDVNAKETDYSYADVFNRLTKITYPDGGETDINYSDLVADVSQPTSFPSVTTTKLLSSSSSISDTNYFDGMGHSVQTVLTSDPQGSDYVDIVYDGMGNNYKSSNSTRCSSYPGVMPTTCSEPSWGITTLNYDPLGRTVLQQNSDNSKKKWCYDGVQAPGVAACPVQTGSITGGTWVDFIDEKGNTWQRSTDGLGRLLEVIEPNGTSQSPSMETDYKYDVLGNLTNVYQFGILNGTPGQSGSINRVFSYDTALSRLQSSSNPESGNISYVYDANGNVKSKTDANNTISYRYDVLNRMLSKSYSDGVTLSSCYQYDSASMNPKGRLGAEWTQSTCPTPSQAPSSGYQSLRAIGAYDAMGRVTSEQQCVLGYCTSASPPSAPTGNCASLSSASGLAYCYDLAGHLTAYTNGLNSADFTKQWLLISQTYDSAGRLASVSVPNSPQSPLVGPQLPANLFSAPSGYTPFGALQTWSLGTNTAITKTYDSRLRVTGLKATGP